MNSKHLAVHFAAPGLMYLALVLYFMTAISIFGTLKDIGFLVLGFVLFILGYNAWYFGKKLRDINDK